MYKILMEFPHLSNLNIPSMEYKRTAFASTDVLYVYNDPTGIIANRVPVACVAKEDGNLYVDMRVKLASWGEVLFGSLEDKMIFAEETMIHFLAHNKTGIKGYVKRYMPNGSVDKWKGQLI